MLVLVNAFITTKRRDIGNEIHRHINGLKSYPVGDYTAVIEDVNILIKDSEDNIVYGPDVSSILRNPEDGSKNEAGTQVFEDVISLQDKLRLDQYLQTLTLTEYNDDLSQWTFYDIGVINDDDLDIDEQFIIDAYNNKNFEHLVMVGTFAKEILQRLRTNYGEELKVINIIRNPSAAYYFNNSAFFAEKGEYATGVNEEYGIGPVTRSETMMSLRYLNPEFINCMASAVLIKDLDYVETIKFEDIIENGGLTFNGEFISMDWYTKFNSHIDQYEIDNVVDAMTANGSESIKSTNISTVNSIFGNLSSHVTANNGSDPFTILPSDLIAALGYTPLTKNDLVDPDA